MAVLQMLSSLGNYECQFDQMFSWGAEVIKMLQLV